MEQKKSSKVNLENGISSHLLMGMVVALAGIFVAFEWTSEKRVYETGIQNEEYPSYKTIYSRAFSDEKRGNSCVVMTEDEWLDQIYWLADHMYQSDEYKILIPIGAEGKQINIKEVKEEMPQFPGGDYELFRYIEENIEYPSEAIQKGIEGEVICSFRISRGGNTFDCEIVNDVHPALAKEAERLIYSMPAWKPARTIDNRTSVRYYLPIQFRLS